MTNPSKQHVSENPPDFKTANYSELVDHNGSSFARVYKVTAYMRSQGIGEVPRKGDVSPALSFEESKKIADEIDARRVAQGLRPLSAKL